MDYSKVFAEEQAAEKHGQLDLTTKHIRADDPAQLLKRFAEFEPIMKEIEVKADAITVTDDESCAQASEMSHQGRTLINRMEARRKEVLEPFNGVVTAVNRCCKSIRDRVQAVVYGLDNKSRAHMIEKKRQKQEAERKAREEAAKIQAEQEAKRQEQIDKAELEGWILPEPDIEPVSVAVIAPPVETKVKTEYGSSDVKEIDTWEITKFQDLPDAAFEGFAALGHDHYTGKKNSHPINTWIGKQLAAGVRSIPGVRVFKLEVVKSRVR